MSPKDKAKNKRLIAKYGITLDEYNQKLKDQNDSCAFCGKHKDNFKRALHVDHNHKTGQVRGLVCFYCNSQLIRKHNKHTAKLLKLYMDVHEP
jgi:hypothetical protein